MARSYRGGEHWWLRAVVRPYWVAVASGLMLVAAFPRPDYGFLAWVALAPLLVDLAGCDRGEGLRRGFVFGLVYFFGAQYWVYHSIYHYGGVPLYAALASALLLAVYCALYTAVFGLIYAHKMAGSSLPASLVAPVLWVLMEYLRGWLFTGFPWSLVGYTQWRYPLLIQVADITGVYGISYLALAVNGLLAEAFIVRKRRARMPLYPYLPALMGGALVVVLLMGTILYGNHRLGETPVGDDVKVAIVQGSVDQSQKWDQAHRDEVLAVYKGLTLDAASGGARLVVWPETAAPVFFGRDERHTAMIRSAASEAGVYLLLGTLTMKGDGAPANSAVFIGPDGEVMGAYDKIHLVPFGEYVPMKDALFFINRLVEGIGEYRGGKEYSLMRMETPGGGQAGLATVICYEAIFPSLVRKFFRTGEGDMLVNITNDAWFGRTSGPYQHFAMPVLRAVENRKPVVRAANTGISGFVDSHGRVMEAGPLFERTVLMAGVRLDRTRTFYTRYGDLFAYLCIVGTIVFLIYHGRGND